MDKDLTIYREKLRRYYEDDGRLTQYPQKRPMRIIALLKIAERFEAGRTYTEKEVNEIIKNSITFHDVELVRRAASGTVRRIGWRRVGKSVTAVIGKRCRAAVKTGPSRMGRPGFLHISGQAVIE